MKLLYMPEAMIIYRFYFEGIGMTDKWWNKFSSLSDEKKAIIKPIIESNDFTDYEKTIKDAEMLEVLSFYRIKREDAEKEIKQAELK